MSTVPLRGFYAILDVKEQAAVDLPVVLGRAEELLRARPACLQLRAKRLGAGPALVIARALTPLCRAAGVPFCVNDRLDLALAAEADAVHVGQDDLPLGEVRRVLGALGRSLLVGVSTHDLAQARAAAA